MCYDKEDDEVGLGGGYIEGLVQNYGDAISHVLTLLFLVAVKLEGITDVDFSSDDVSPNNSHEETTKCPITRPKCKVQTQDSAVNTDICNDEDLPEVEILSLIEEQIPRYRLRADTITDFYGYNNQDWIQTPVLPHIDDADLTPELIEETLKYFVLCSDRLTQMTKTYNDVEAVTRLLEEKERDLELAARIGQTLLEKNKTLEERNELLEDQISQANERINQLKHELSMKDELLQIYTLSYEGHESSPDGATPNGHEGTLHKKIRSLEDENLQLHLETSHLKATTDSLEEKEAKLVNDCVQQLEDVHLQLGQFAKELSEKTEESANQKEEITNLLSQIVTLQKKNRTLTVENLELQKTLEAAHDAQNYLTREIVELKEKNEELLFHLEESQEEVRRLRSRDRPSAVRHNYMSSLNPPRDSLASELENSLRSEVDYPRGYSPMERKRHNWKVFETAKAAKAAAGNNSMCGSSLGSLSMLGTSGIESAESQSVSQRSSMYFSDAESGVSEGYCGDVESLYGGGRKLGRPGVPGSNDLHRALRRLSMRRANELNEMDYVREERERNERQRTLSELEGASDQESHTPTRCRTPDSHISGNSGYISMTGSGVNPYFRMPEKLRIVKPLEGSVTLRNWQRLATPHLGGIFENRPGVQIKGEAKLDVEPEVYNLSDYEEDDDLSDYPTRFQESSGVYTYTDSTVRHPSEAARTSTSFTSSTPRMAAGGPPTQNYGTSTYSMSMGLASLLNERDLLTTPPEGAPNPAYRSSSMASSNPERFPSLVSDTHFNGQMSTQTTSMTLLTNNYNLIPSPSTVSQRATNNESELSSNDSLTSSSEVTAIASSAPSMSPNSLTAALGVINKLKNSGMNVYGYLSGGLSYSDGEGQSQGQSQGQTQGQSQGQTHENNTNLRPDSLPLTSVTSSVSNTAVTMTTACYTNTASGGATSDMVTATTTTAESPKKRTLTSYLTTRAVGGVIGALTMYKKDKQ